MSEMEIRRQRSNQLINDALPYLDTEQTLAFANAIMGAAVMNRIVAQMRNVEAQNLMAELTRFGVGATAM